MHIIHDIRGRCGNKNFSPEFPGTSDYTQAASVKYPLRASLPFLFSLNHERRAPSLAFVSFAPIWTTDQPAKEWAR